MCRLTLFVFIALTACSSDPSDRAAPWDTTEEQAAPNSHADDAPGVAPDMRGASDLESTPDMRAAPALEPECACAVVDTCCDGCRPINLGASCDDGLHCMEGSSCQSDGSCGGGAAVTCDPIDPESPHIDCLELTCFEEHGCGGVAANEGVACERAPGVSGVCQGGFCRTD